LAQGDLSQAAEEEGSYEEQESAPTEFWTFFHYRTMIIP
jgi:hypothetical protein